MHPGCVRRPHPPPLGLAVVTLVFGVFLATACNEGTGTSGPEDVTTIGPADVLGVWDLESVNGEPVPGFVTTKYQVYADTLFDTTFVEFGRMTFDTWESDGEYAYGRVLDASGWAWGGSLSRRDSMTVFVHYRLDLKLGTFTFDSRSEPTFDDEGPYAVGTAKISGDRLERSRWVNLSIYRRR